MASIFSSNCCRESKKVELLLSNSKPWLFPNVLMDNTDKPNANTEMFNAKAALWFLRHSDKFTPKNS